MYIIYIMQRMYVHYTSIHFSFFLEETDYTKRQNEKF